MQLFILVLNRQEWVEPLFEEMMKAGFTGGTVLESTGMMRVLDTEDPDLPMFGMIRHLIDPQRKKSKTIMILVKDEQVKKLAALVNRVTGGLNKPDTGIAFAVPTLFVEGLMES